MERGASPSGRAVQRFQSRRCCAHNEQMTLHLRYLAAAAVLTLTAILVPASSVQADDVYLCDQPRRDEPDPTADLDCVGVRLNERLVVNAEFIQAFPPSDTEAGSRYTTLVDPARINVGPRFLLRVGVRGDWPPERFTTPGRMFMATSPTSDFNRIGCADIRTRIPTGGDTVVISIPARCMLRHAPLGNGVHVQLHSKAPGGGDYLPNEGTFFVARG